MKKFYELLDTKFQLPVFLKLTPLTEKSPHVEVRLNNHRMYAGNPITEVAIHHYISSRDFIKLTFTITGKNYTEDNTSAIIFQALTVDGVDLKPHVTQRAEYKTDQDWGVYDKPTDHFGWNGTWYFESNKPFFHLKHEIKNYGWMLTPKTTTF
jgi:hypothetical protein